MSNAFQEIINNFEDSMRGRAKVNGVYVKAFPHTAGSVFISKIVSLLRSIVNDRTIYSKLEDRTVKERIYRNGKALVVMQVLDETVEVENMLLIFESFQNVSIDTYLGMKFKGQYGELQQKLREGEQPAEAEEELID